MSKYLVFQDVVFTDKALLLEALGAMGWDKTKIEEGDKLRLVGYQGDVRKQTADIVIRRKYLTGASNDLGFVKTDKNGYTPIISDYDSHALKRGRFLPELRTAYETAAIKKIARQQGGTVAWKQEGTLMKAVVRF